MLPVYSISSQPIKRFTHTDFTTSPIAAFFILNWPVQKCRRLNIALQVIHYSEDQIWNWERFGKERKERERATTTTHKYPQKHMIRGTSWRKVTGSTRDKCQPSRVNEGSFHSPNCSWSVNGGLLLVAWVFLPALGVSSLFQGFHVITPVFYPISPVSVCACLPKDW